MYRILTLSALAALALGACKPTPRTALAQQNPTGQKQQAADEQTDSPATPPATEPLTPTTPATPTEPPESAPATAPVPEASPVAASLLTVSSTRQDFSRLRPWEKEESSTSEFTGIYLGEGNVLTLGTAARAATYVELSLPDGSRSVPAHVLRYDADLNLALLAPVHGEDASLFESRRPLALGEPLKLGDTAEVDALVRGIIPVRIPLLAVNNEVADIHPLLDMPRISLRAAQPLPEGSLNGLPVLREGKLVGIGSGGNRETQELFCINAELISRFLNQAAGTPAGCPIMGIRFTQLDDPVLRAYLKLGTTQGGLYVSEVAMGSAAEQAGLREGDVVLAIEGLPLDAQGRCVHPLYGSLDAGAVLSSLKPMGETLTLTISRSGEQQSLSVPLNADALHKGIPAAPTPAGTQPRYVVWGGLLFQPMTQDVIVALMSRSNGTLPVQFMEVDRREKELREKGVTELVMLTQVIPTPATLSYESVRYCLVEAVNGKPVHSFAEFVHLLDEPTPDGLVSFSLNKAPYTIYVDRQVAEACNSTLRRSALQQLRQLGDEAAAAAPAAPATETPQPQG